MHANARPGAPRVGEDPEWLERPPGPRARVRRGAIALIVAAIAVSLETAGIVVSVVVASVSVPVHVALVSVAVEIANIPIAVSIAGIAIAIADPDIAISIAIPAPKGLRRRRGPGHRANSGDDEKHEFSSHGANSRWALQSIID
jgi:hypothetical protein